MAVLDWSDDDKATFLTQQLEAQTSYWRQQYPDTERLIVTDHDFAVGRLYLDRQNDEIHILDIALLPNHQKRGLGGALLQRVLDEAQETARSVRIYVERNNQALRLYERLGFRPVEDLGVYLRLEWSPSERS
jgi:ribosomal protein S18 acetylase RimI-like enzyme